MSGSFTLRRATVDDIDLVIELRETMWREGALDMDSTDAGEALDNARKYFQETVPRGEYVCFLAEAEGRVVGASGMFLYRHPPRPRSPRGVEGYILNMLTLPEWRRRGIASAIVRGASGMRVGGEGGLGGAASVGGWQAGLREVRIRGEPELHAVRAVTLRQQIASSPAHGFEGL